MQSGYAHEFDAADGYWMEAPDDAWDTVMVTPSEAAGAVHQGWRHIDGTACTVYRSADGAKFWAVSGFHEMRT